MSLPSFQSSALCYFGFVAALIFYHFHRKRSRCAFHTSILPVFNSPMRVLCKITKSRLCNHSQSERTSLTFNFLKFASSYIEASASHLFWRKYTSRLAAGTFRMQPTSSQWHCRPEKPYRIARDTIHHIILQETPPPRCDLYECSTPEFLPNGSPYRDIKPNTNKLETSGAQYS